MTWATNHSDRHHAGILEVGPRAKPIVKICAKCPAAIDQRAKYCGPCRDVRQQEHRAENKKRRRAAARLARSAEGAL